jgi:Flp pilus assembly protein TadG
MAKCLQKETFTRVFTPFLRRLASDVRGQSLVEFAFVFPILIMLFLSIFFLGRAISVYQALGRAAREGARVALAPTCASCGDLANYAAVNTAVNNALAAASLNTSNATISVTAVPILNPSDPTNYQVSGVTVTVTYPFQINVTMINTTINMSQTASMRQEF